MNKIPTIFLRPERAGKGPLTITREPHPDCGWVFDGEGIATEKLDGMNVRLTVRARTIVRVEKRRNPTKEQKAAGIVDPWYVDADVKAPEDKWIFEAVSGTNAIICPDGEHCCEALGPNIQGNPLGLEHHVCIAFDLAPAIYLDAPRSHDELRVFLAQLDSKESPGHLAEGIVFHHPDGRRAKIKRKDFGL